MFMRNEQKVTLLDSQGRLNKKLFFHNKFWPSNKKVIEKAKKYTF